ncbi:ABC transporter substrate-binding protein [Neobacillus sp. WH10]|uniref:ABC transporter substrate-binding protein n=1 Tax=Neobacillus sp. WH10 TaxID=3047873 RepID=UPI0024C1E90D|nr:ABC transporter substrate-binding protein [Neobacillus sp. WH10]WHY75383.1 ABC transporter substrate-binding protein [Neobacillus sp. WH10]
MKTKWYFFILIIIIVSVLINNFINHREDSPTKIGVIMMGNSRVEKLTGLKKGMRELGYKEDAIEFDVKNALDNEKTLDKKIDELINEKPALIVTMGGIETLALKEKMEEQKTNIPVVFAGVAAPKELGLIKDYRSPGGFFTGVNNYHTSLSGKRLELLHQLVPTAKRFFVLYDKKNKVSVLSLENTIDAAKSLALPIIPVNVSDPKFTEFLSGNIQQDDALLMVPGFRMESLTEKIAKIIKENKIPAMGVYGNEVEEGILASYGSSFEEQGYQAARYVSRILQGNSPADLPVELPDTIHFFINTKVKDELGIELNSEITNLAEFIKPEREGAK